MATRIRSLRRSLHAVARRLRALRDDQRGQMPVGPLLVIGLIVIPLVILLITFRAELITWIALNVVDVYTAPEIETF